MMPSTTPYQVNLVEVHLRLTAQRREMRPRRPLDALSLFAILQLVVYSTVKHYVVAALAEGVDLCWFVRACGDLLPHTVAHLNDACGCNVSYVGKKG